MDEQAAVQLQDDYRVFSRGPVYADLVQYLDASRDAALNKAEDETEPMRAVSLLQNASAYKTIKEYILRMSVPNE